MNKKLIEEAYVNYKQLDKTCPSCLWRLHVHEMYKHGRKQADYDISKGLKVCKKCIKEGGGMELDSSLKTIQLCRICVKKYGLIIVEDK